MYIHTLIASANQSYKYLCESLLAMKRTIRVIGTFSKSYLPVSLVINLVCLLLFQQYKLSILGSLFWFKALSVAAIVYFLNAYKRREYYYYLNLGYSKVVLWSVIVLTDIIFLSLLLIFVSNT